MTDREIICHLAEKVMGWEIKTNPNTGNIIAVDRDDFTLRVHLFGDSPMLRRWNPLESIADAFEVQAAIPQEKHKKFCNALAGVMWPGVGPLMFCNGLDAGKEMFGLIVATPRQRCLAAVEITR